MDLNAQYIKAAVKNVASVFLMTDSQVAEEQFLVLINDLLASGEIPGLFTEEEVENIISSMRPQVKSQGMADTREVCWKFFIEKVRRQLKVRSPSPRGPGGSARCPEAWWGSAFSLGAGGGRFLPGCGNPLAVDGQVGLPAGKGPLAAFVAILAISWPKAVFYTHTHADKQQVQIQIDKYTLTFTVASEGTGVELGRGVLEEGGVSPAKGLTPQTFCSSGPRESQPVCGQATALGGLEEAPCPPGGPDRLKGVWPSLMSGLIHSVWTPIPRPSFIPTFSPPWRVVSPQEGLGTTPAP